MAEPTSVALDEPPWESWAGAALAARSHVRWKLLFSQGRTPTGAMSMGLAEIRPGSIEPLHHHEPAEIYHVMEGEGVAEVDEKEYRLRPDVSLFIPPDARHGARCTSEAPLRLLFVFPTDSFEEVAYRFDG